MEECRLLCGITLIKSNLRQKKPNAPFRYIKTHCWMFEVFFPFPFLFQVWFVGDKIGEGVGRTRKDAQRQAAEISLHNLASKIIILYEFFSVTGRVYIRNCSCFGCYYFQVYTGLAFRIMYFMSIEC